MKTPSNTSTSWNLAVLMPAPSHVLSASTLQPSRKKDIFPPLPDQKANTKSSAPLANSSGVLSATPLWHEGVNCKEYKKGDKLLRHWASEIEHGQRNAQKCPKCKVQLGQVEIKCPITECFEFLEETTVIYNLTHVGALGRHAGSEIIEPQGR